MWLFIRLGALMTEEVILERSTISITVLHDL